MGSEKPGVDSTCFQPKTSDTRSQLNMAAV